MNSVSQFISFYDDSCALASVLQAWGKAGAEGEDNGSVVILIGNELPENLLEKTNMRRFWKISEADFPPSNITLQLKSSVPAISMTGL